MGNIVPIIIISIIGLGVIALIVYYVLKFMRGSLKISIPKTAYNAGEKKNYQFVIDTPNAQSPEVQNSPWGGDILKTGLKVLGGRHIHLRWQLVARLDAKGIDLSDSKNISINM